MCRACSYAESTSKMIQVRDVTDDMHRTLKARGPVVRAAKRPTMREWLQRPEQTKPIRTRQSAAQIVRALRDPR
jgi:hypothetical protein